MYGNPARSDAVRDYISGLRKEKLDQGEKSNSSLPFMYSDMIKVETIMIPRIAKPCNKYQVELVLYVPFALKALDYKGDRSWLGKEYRIDFEVTQLFI